MLTSTLPRKFSRITDPVPSSLSGVRNSILVVEDVAETRDGIEILLKADGYHVEVARDIPDAILSARRWPPELILVSLSGSAEEVIANGRWIREGGAVSENVPVVIFCDDEIAEGDEVEIGRNVYVTRPDNFNQLRRLLARLLENSPTVFNLDGSNSE